MPVKRTLAYSMRTETKGKESSHLTLAENMPWWRLQCFMTLNLSMNDHNSVVGIDFGITSKF